MELKPQTWGNMFFIDEEFKQSNTFKHAIKEFDATYTSFDDEMQVRILQNVMELLQALYHQGHSGFSGSYALGLFNRLANFQSIKGD